MKESGEPCSFAGKLKLMDYLERNKDIFDKISEQLNKAITRTKKMSEYYNNAITTKTKNCKIIKWTEPTEEDFIEVFIYEDAPRKEVIKQLREHHIYVKSCYYPIYVNDGYMYIGIEDDNHIWFSRDNKRPLAEGLKDLDCNIHKIFEDFYY